MHSEICEARRLLERFDVRVVNPGHRDERRRGRTHPCIVQQRHRRNGWPPIDGDIISNNRCRAQRRNIARHLNLRGGVGTKFCNKTTKGQRDRVIMRKCTRQLAVRFDQESLLMTKSGGRERRKSRHVMGIRKTACCSAFQFPHARQRQFGEEHAEFFGRATQKRPCSTSRLSSLRIARSNANPPHSKSSIAPDIANNATALLASKRKRKRRAPAGTDSRAALPLRCVCRVSPYWDPIGLADAMTTVVRMDLLSGGDGTREVVKARS